MTSEVGGTCTDTTKMPMSGNDQVYDINCIGHLHIAKCKLSKKLIQTIMIWKRNLKMCIPESVGCGPTNSKKQVSK